MTAPVATDDLVQGAVKYLLEQETVLAVVGSTADDVPWLFQHRLYVAVEGSSSTAAVIAYGGGWAGGNEHNTLRFPRLSLELWVDPRRDDDRNSIEPGEVYRRMNVAFTAFDRVLHRPQGGEQWWGTVRTISCIRSAEPIPYEVPDGDGLLRLQTFYAIEQG
jgi:hypothetical protein